MGAFIIAFLYKCVSIFYLYTQLMFETLRQYKRYPVTTGAILASSEVLADAIVDLAQLKSVNSVVECGSGTGVFTEKIFKEIKPGTTFFAIELNPNLAIVTRRRCPKAEVYNDSAEKIEKYLKLNELSSCDRIISGLPWASLSRKTQEDNLEAAVSALRSGGKFLTVVYAHSHYSRNGEKFVDLLLEKFAVVERSEIIWKNLPPAFIYRCTK